MNNFLYLHYNTFMYIFLPIVLKYFFGYFKFNYKYSTKVITLKIGETIDRVYMKDANR